MKQLKDALLNAGVVSQKTLKEIEKEKVLRRHKRHSKRDRADQIHIVCEACDKSAPDVEEYDHNNKRLGRKTWFCIQCADEYQIDDKHRVTNQSSQAKQGMFIRRFGRTKQFRK